MSSTNGNGHAGNNGPGPVNENGPLKGSANGHTKRQGKNHLNGQGEEGPPPRSNEKGKSSGGGPSVLEQTINLRDQARSLAQGLSQLIQTLRQQRKQNRLVATTLSSLRSLKELAVGT